MQFSDVHRVIEYDRGIEAGLSDADAAELVEDLKAVTPLEGEDNVKQYQNWRVAIDNAVNEKNQLTLLKSVGMNDASYAKCEAAWGQGIAPAAYVRAKAVAMSPSSSYCVLMAPC